MKKFVFMVLTAMGMALWFTGCSSSADSEDTYRIEMGVISNSTYNVAMDRIYSYGADITYANVKSIRDYCYANTTSNYDNSTTGVKKEEIRDFLVSKGLTTLQANAEVSVLETLGNDIAFFYYAYSSSSKVWMYAVKE